MIEIIVIQINILSIVYILLVRSAGVSGTYNGTSIVIIDDDLIIICYVWFLHID